MGTYGAAGAAADAFHAVGVFSNLDGHRTGSLAFAAGNAAFAVESVAEEGFFVKKAVDRAERAEVPTKPPQVGAASIGKESLRPPEAVGSSPPTGGRREASLPGKCIYRTRAGHGR